MKLETTDHSYYCSDSNYYAPGGNLLTYESWDHFKEEWNPKNIDHDLNHVFRFDIVNGCDEEGEDDPNKFELYLYYMIQRKGNFIPVRVYNIVESDMGEINDYLKSCADYIKGQWKEFI